MRYIEATWIAISALFGLWVTISLIKYGGEQTTFGNAEVASILVPAVAVPCGFCASMVTVVVGSLVRALVSSVSSAIQARKAKKDE